MNNIVERKVANKRISVPLGRIFCGTQMIVSGTWKYYSVFGQNESKKNINGSRKNTIDSARKINREQIREEK